MAIGRILFAAGMACGVASLHYPVQLHAQVQAQPKANDSVKWQAFESVPGRYRVIFPGAPVMKRGNLRTDIGDVVSIRHTADSPDATYDVTYNDYPKEGVARLRAASLLEAARDGLVYQAQGHLASDRPISPGKVPGRELEIMGKNGMLYRVRLLLVGNRLYQLTAMALPPARPEEQKFFNSFQLTGSAP